MQRNPDGSIILAPGEQAPGGYQIVQQGADGSAYAIPAGGAQSRQPTGGSSMIAPAAIGYGAYQLAKPYLTSSAAPSLVTNFAIPGTAPAAATSSVPATPTMLSINGAAPVTPSFSGLAGGQLNLASGAAGLAGGYLGHDLLSRGQIKPERGLVQGAASGAGLGYMVGGPVGAGIGAGVGGLVGLGKSIFGHKMSEFELMQQNVRTGGGQAGLFYWPNNSPHANMQLADGSYHDIEKGGYAVETIQDLPGSKQAIEWVNPLAVVLTAGGDDQGSKIYLAGSLANGVMANANGDLEVIRANVLKQMENTGLTEDKIKASLLDLKNAGKIDEGEYNLHLHSLDVLLNGDQSKYDNQTFSQFIAGGGYGGTPQTAPGSPGTQTPATAPGSPARGEGPANIEPTILIKGPDGKPLTGQALKDAMAQMGVGQTPSGGWQNIGTGLAPSMAAALAQYQQSPGNRLPSAAPINPSFQLPEGHRVATGSQMPDQSAVKSAAQMAAALAGRMGSPVNNWDNAVASGQYRPGSAAAGGFVDNKTGKWYPSTAAVPR